MVSLHWFSFPTLPPPETSPKFFFLLFLVFITSLSSFYDLVLLIFLSDRMILLCTHIHLPPLASRYMDLFGSLACFLPHKNNFPLCLSFFDYLPPLLVQKFIWILESYLSFPLIFEITSPQILGACQLYFISLSLSDGSLTDHLTLDFQ